MSHNKSDSDPIDRLVRQFLESQEALVDAKAFLARLNKRRRRMRLLRRLVWPALASAAALLIAAGVFLALARRTDRVVPPDVRLPTAAAREWETPLREQIQAALRGARDVGEAALSAGETPLLQLAQSELPALPDQMEVLLHDMLSSASELSSRAGPALREMVKKTGLSLSAEEATP